MMIPRRTGPPLTAEKRRERIERRIAIFEARRPAMKDADGRARSKDAKARDEYVIDKQLQRHRRSLENHDRFYAQEPQPAPREGPSLPPSQRQR